MRKVASEHPFYVLKVAGEHAFCVLINMNSDIFHIYLILFIFWSKTFLIFDFICLTSSLATATHMELPNTHAHTNEDTHTNML